MSDSATQIPDGHKFSALILENIRSVSLADAARLGTDIICFPSPPFLPNEFWTKEFGERFARKFENGKLFVVHHHSSNSSTDADNENKILTDKASIFLIALWLTKSLIYDSATIVTGYKLDGNFHIRTVPSLAAHYLPSSGVSPHSIGLPEMRQAHEIHQRLQRIYDEPGKWNRLRGGIRAFMQGLASFSAADERTHQFVRALDAIVMTRRRQGESDFVARCAHFLDTNPKNEASLRKMYQLRNASEHFGEWMPVVSSGGTADADLLTRQAEELAGRVLGGILIDDVLLSKFVNENSIGVFWDGVENGSATDWTAPLDLNSIS